LAFSCVEKAIQYLNIETEMIISLLKLTRQGPVSHEIIKKEVRVPSEVARKLLTKLQDDQLVYVQGDLVAADNFQRLKLAIHAIQSGADPERVSAFLHWREFEGMAAVAFEQKGYKIQRNLRFKHGGRRWEIDIVGCRKPLAVCVDCKHWHHPMHPSSLKKIVEEQVERTRALAESLRNPAVKTEFALWDSVRFIPTVLSLLVGRFKFYDNTPIVPVLQLQDFLDQLPGFADSLSTRF
jgi:Holliday junction resolvase-like predicted endonuclease